MYIVTGGLGFIGSNIVKALNAKGIKNILIVDDISDINIGNISGAKYKDIMSIHNFRKSISEKKSFGQIEAISHQGACSNTMQNNAEYLFDNNLIFSEILMDYALHYEIPLVYASSASVYGNSFLKKNLDSLYSPLNLYATSKYLMDVYAQKRMKTATRTFVGLRYFNVYGPGEKNKGNMASSVLQFWNQLNKLGEISLFKYKDCQPKRDFVYVSDIVKVNLFFLLRDEPIKGIFDVGTGEERSYEEIAKNLIKLNGGGQIKYVNMPSKLINHYQFLTKANLLPLIEYLPISFVSLEDGIREYICDILNYGGDNENCCI